MQTLRRSHFMKLRELTAYSDKLLKGKRMRALLVCLMLWGTELFFRLAEAAVYSVILYFSGMKPAGLFTGESALQQTIALICTVLRCLTTAPLIYAAAYWFTELCGESRKRRKTSLTRVILNRKIYGRSLAALVFSKAAGFIFLIPAALFGKTAYALISAGIDGSAEIHLFMSVHAAVLTILSLGLWLGAKLALLSVPFLMIRFPERNVLRLLRDSFSFMKGRRGTLLKIFARYIPPMALIITIPFLLPKLFAAVALFISISLREDEYLEGNKIHSEVGKARHASKLPAWRKRRFTAAADKAQAAGYGDNA